MQFFFRTCTYILTRTQGKKFEDMFLIKIASKGASLKQGAMKAQEMKLAHKPIVRGNENL